MIGCALVILAAGGNYYTCFDPSIRRKGFLILTFAPKVLIYHNVQQSVGFKRSYTTNLSQMLGISGQLERHHWKTWGGCIIGCLVVSKEKKEREQEKESFSWTFITARRSPRSWPWSLVKFGPVFAAVICMCHMLYGAQVYYLEHGWPMGLWEVCLNLLAWVLRWNCATSTIAVHRDLALCSWVNIGCFHT